MSDHVDMAALGELKEVMEDDFGLLLETFFADSDTRKQAIADAIAAADAEQLRTSAHAFKGSAGNMAASRLTELCQQLETMGREGQVDGADAVFQQVLAEYDHVKAALDSLL